MPEENLVPVHFTRHPFHKEGLAKRTLPFALPVLLSFAVFWMPRRGTHDPDLLLTAVGLALLLLAAVFVIPWQRLPVWVSALPPLGHIAIIFLIREGMHISTPLFAPLLLVPLFWLSLYGSRKQLLVGFLFVVGTYCLSLYMHGYDPQELKFLAVACLSAPVVCFTAQELVLTVRSQAHELEALAHRDELTGAANRREWQTALPREIARAQRHGRPVAVALLDLDGLKELNDESGHQAGDRLLKGAVAAWREHLRAGDLLARVGGDEFAVLLPECDPGGAEEIVNRLRRSTPDGKTVSVGVACWDGTEPTAELMQRADRALYRAKEEGRNRTVIDGVQEPGPVPAPAKKRPRKRTATKKRAGVKDASGKKKPVANKKTTSPRRAPRSSDTGDTDPGAVGSVPAVDPDQ